MSVRPDTRKKDELKRKNETETEKKENKKKKLDNVHYGSWEEVELLNVDWEARFRKANKRRKRTKSKKRND